MRHCFERGPFLAELIQEWTDLWPPYNWATFHPVMIEFEDDAALGGFEVTIILMGLGFRIRWNHTRTEMVERIERQITDLQAKWDAED